MRRVVDKIDIGDGVAPDEGLRDDLVELLRPALPVLRRMRSNGWKRWGLNDRAPLSDEGGDMAMRVLYNLLVASGVASLQLRTIVVNPEQLDAAIRQLGRRGKRGVR